jgi:hypothetical protein
LRRDIIIGFWPEYQGWGLNLDSGLFCLGSFYLNGFNMAENIEH